MNQRRYFRVPLIPPIPPPIYYSRNAPPFWPVYVFCDPYGPDYYGEYGRPSRYPAFSAQSRALTSFLRRAPRARMEPMERQRRSILATPATEDVAEQKNESGDHDVRIREITEDMEKVAVHQGPATSPLAGANKSVDVPPKDEHQRTTVAAATSQSDVAEQTDQWLYQDNQGRVHGPFSGSRMAAWFVAGNLMVSLPIKRTCDAEFQTLGQVMKSWGRVPFQSDGSHLGDGPFLPPMLPVPLLQRDLWSASGTSCSPTQQPSSAREDVHEMGSKDQPPLTSFEHENTKSPDMRPDLEEGRVSSVSNPTLMVSAFQPIQPASLGVRNLSANIHDDSQKAAVLGSNREPLEGACGGYAMVQQQPEVRPLALSTCVDTASSVRSHDSRGTTAWGHRNPSSARTSWNEPEFPAISRDASVNAPTSRELSRGEILPGPSLPWERRCAADREFTRWTFEALKTLPSYVHAPTFLELLRDVDSEKEIEEYILMHLGEGDDAKKFAREFILQRRLWKNLTG
ncbi:unnamed protein product [Ixodes persulcatus]